MSYSSQTVAQLKELLKGRELSTTGIKSELIARLEEADKSAAQPTEEAHPEEVALPEETLEEEELLEIDEEPSKDEPAEKLAEEEEPKSTETKEETTEDVEKPKTIKELTPEERKAAAVELLNKKIIRAKKFGTEEQVEAAQKDLARVEKFGVELGTSLAKEIGIASSEGLREGRRFDKNRRNGRGKFRGRHGGARKDRK